MSDAQNFGFGKFVPGFDFLQNLATSAVKGASTTIPQLPNLGNWIAPTLNVEELDKRIGELKAVQFWLDQNATALKATIQALEVQKMTLATLKGMNFNMGDVANAFKLKAADTVFGGMQKVSEKASDAARAVSNAAASVSDSAAAAQAAAASDAPARAKAKKAAPQAAGVVDPMQWWGSLTQQFQQIAAGAMKDAARQTALDTTRHVATGLAKEAFKSAKGVAKSAARSAGQYASKKIADNQENTRTSAVKSSKTARKAPAKATSRRTTR